LYFLDEYFLVIIDLVASFLSNDIFEFTPVSYSQFSNTQLQHGPVIPVCLDSCFPFPEIAHENRIEPFCLCSRQTHPSLNELTHLFPDLVIVIITTLRKTGSGSEKRQT
jgi:hypothetical protein